MKSEKLRNLSKKVLPQILMQSFVIIITAITSFMFMTWLVHDVFFVTDTYIAAAYETLGSLVIFTVILVPLNTVVYRRRTREIRTLSEAIQQVAHGDYDTQIDCNQKSQMTPIYEDFNKMCAELASVQILRNDFINSYSHEFKTPIASINGFSSLMLEKKLPDSERRQYLEIIEQESARLANLASNTILLSRISSQQIVSDMEQYDLSEQIRQCSIILSKLWLEKKIEFSGEFSEVQYLGNKELMQHLWLNLLGNSIKFTPIGGEISVTVSSNAQQLSVSFADTGEGIDEETRQHLFEPYYQGDSSRASQGLGLGLAIAKRIVELCGGAITVTSELSVGSNFIVTLPLK
jgi:signal transduction histidine kinase